VPSSTAATRYRRQGGRWLDARTGPGVCDTCRNGDARYRARHTASGEEWQVCETCAGQARRLDAPVALTPLAA
jgi:hypothetical protein